MHPSRSILLMVGLTCGLLWAQAAGEPAQPNLLLIMTDDQGYWELGSTGNPHIDTPNLDALAKSGVRSPLFVRWPGRFPAGGVVRGQASQVDLLPTLCELGGAKVPTDQAIDGRSLLPLLRAGTGDRHHEYVYRYWNRMLPTPDANWAVSDQRFKLGGASGASGKKKAAGWELFDLEADPGERINLAAARLNCLWLRKIE